MGGKRVNISKDRLKELYEERGLSQAQIAELYGCDPTTISNKMHAYGIPSRTLSAAAILQRGVNIPRGELEDSYEKQSLSIREIARLYGYADGTVRNQMRKYGIKGRSMSKASTIYPKRNFSGDPKEKAYLIGFRLGDLHVRMPHENSEIILVECSSTRQEQVDLIKSLFERYGHVQLRNPRGHKTVNITCSLNTSFAFLLPKEDRIEEWILKDDDCFGAFLAGYIDAEGHIGVGNGIARFDLASYDGNILQQIHDRLIAFGIVLPELRIMKAKGSEVRSPKDKYDNPQYVTSQDLWCFTMRRKRSLSQLFALIEPYIKHKGRLEGIKRAKRNIGKRNQKFGNRHRK